MITTRGTRAIKLSGIANIFTEEILETTEKTAMLIEFDLLAAVTRVDSTFCQRRIVAVPFAVIAYLFEIVSGTLTTL